MIRRLMTGAQVARALGYSPGYFYKILRPRLEAEGFPLPCHAGKYDPAAIEAWQDTQIPAHLQPGVKITADPGIERRAMPARAAE